MADFEADYRALRGAAGAVRLSRDFVRVSGPDTWDYLQGQLSQDVSGLTDGEAELSLLLQPQGKLDAVVRVLRVGDVEAVLDTDAGQGDVVVERLRRFKLRTKVDLDTLPEWGCVALRGPHVGETTGTGVNRIPVHWPGVDGVDVVGEGVGVPEGVRECGIDAYEALRVEAGVPKVGAELTEATIPHEAGDWLVARAVSFTKGCFTGQELVARIESRGGNVARRLRGVVVNGDIVPPRGATIETAEGRVVGELTSVARSIERGSPVALAIVKREVEPPAEVVLRWTGAPAAVVAHVEELPLVP